MQKCSIDIGRVKKAFLTQSCYRAQGKFKVCTSGTQLKTILRFTQTNTYSSHIHFRLVNCKIHAEQKILFMNKTKWYKISKFGRD